MRKLNESEIDFIETCYKGQGILSRPFKGRDLEEVKKAFGPRMAKKIVSDLREFCDRLETSCKKLEQ